MKREVLLGAIATILCLSGCAVVAVHPFVDPQDAVLEPELVGRWSPVDPESDVLDFTIEKLDDQKAYRLTLGELAYHFVAFTLDGELFLDLRQIEPEPPGTHLASHRLIRVHSVSPHLKVSYIDRVWLEHQLEMDPTAIEHRPMSDDGNVIVLTADTTTLRSFLRKHLDADEAWWRYSKAGWTKN